MITCSDDDDIDFSLTLMPDFLSCLVVVGESVVWVRVLVKDERVRVFHIHSFALLIEGVGVEISALAWGSDDLGTQSGHDVLLF